MVVGVDGAPSSAGALQWAANTVGRDGHIHAVTATSPEPDLVPDPLPSDDDAYRSLLADELERAWTEPIRGLVGTVTVEVADDDAATALMQAAERDGSDGIVVGAHISAVGMPKRVGGTIRRLLEDPVVPVIVVPTSVRGDDPRSGPIIVGVGHSEATEAAVRWAANAAAEHGRALGLVRATGDAPVFQLEGMLDLVACYIDPTIRGEWAREDLALLADAAQKATVEEIPIAASAVDGRPTARLVAESAVASLLVIGHHSSRLRGGQHVTQPLRHALTHAHCPVAVVPCPTVTIEPPT